MVTSNLKNSSLGIFLDLIPKNNLAIDYNKMSADIEKLAVFDSRIVQSRPKYAVEKGALSLTNAPFNAIAATQSQHTYNIYVPSENVYVDRAVEWSSTVFMAFTATQTTPPAQKQPLAQYGRDWALCALPLNSLCSTLTATINDTTSVINSQDVLKEVLRLTDYKKNRLQRTCPTMLDKYQSYNDCAGAVNNPLAGVENATDFAEMPNGAWYNVVYTDGAGAPLGDSLVTAAVATPAFAGASYASFRGMPISPPDWNAVTAYSVGNIVQYAGNVYVAAAANSAVQPPFAGTWTLVQSSTAAQQFYFRWGSTEKLVLSPFTFSDCHEWDTGLFGINNIQLIMNLQAPTRIVRSTTAFGVSISAVGYNPGAINVFQNSRINCQFLTPSLDVPLPPKSVVPYMEFPRYITQYNGTAIPSGATQQIQSQTITLPQIPDLFIIYVKPQTYGANEGDWYLPLGTVADGITNPLNVNFDNFSGLLSSQTAEQLYAMSVKNGLDMDFNSWVGEGHSGAAFQYGSLGGNNTQNGGAAAGRVPLVGGLLVLKPSQDITLQTGQAPSLVGNFTFQFNITVKNTSAVAQNPNLYVITANSGFFESIRGSSRIIKGVLSEQDIISAPLAPHGTRDMLQRYVGGKGMLHSMANVLSKAKEIYHQTKPAVSAVRGMLPESGMAGQVKSALGAVGYGTGAGTGAGTGGRHHRGSRGLEARLM
jgi:hypothetical protein